MTVTQSEIGRQPVVICPSREHTPNLADRPSVFLMTNSFETGGSERQFVALAQALDPRVFKVHTGCIQRLGPLQEEVGRVPEFPLGGSLYGWHSGRTRLALARHLQKQNIAIAHAFDFYTNLTLIPAARLAGVPVIIGSQRQLGDLLTPWQSQIQRMAFRLCDAVVCNSDAAADGLRQQGVNPRRIRIIANGLAPSYFSAVSAALPRRSGWLRVGMIARMNTTAKNHSLVLRAAGRLQKLGNVEFLFAGEGPLRPSLERQATEIGLRNIVFLGDRKDIPALLASLDICVAPSSSESLSNSIIESMAAGVPVVATRVGGNPELIDHDRGILVKPGDEPGLASAIEQLLLNPELRARLGANARTFARKNFTIEQMQERHQTLYAELLEKKQWRPQTRDQSAGSKLRVSIIAASSRYVGGQSVQAEMLLKNWRRDPEIEAELVPIDPRFPPGLRWMEGVPGLRTLIRQPLYLWALWKGLKDADVAHIFSASYWSFLLAPAPALWMARVLRKKAIIHYHSGEARDHLSRFPGAVRTLRKADAVVVPSKYLAKVFQEFDVPAKIVPNVVDETEFRFRLRSPLRPHLICTRGFHPYYCVDVAVRAFARVQQFFPDAQLDLVGGGPCEAQIRSLVEELGASGVNFVGVASRQTISQFYGAADIFINASRLDNMPVSILEAFAAGLPVVSSSPEGMEYVVENGRTGMLSAVGDSMTLADNVMQILKDDDLACSLALNAHQQVLNYSWDKVRRQWLDIYRQVRTAASTHSQTT